MQACSFISKHASTSTLQTSEKVRRSLFISCARLSFLCCAGTSVRMDIVIVSFLHWLKSKESLTDETEIPIKTSLFPPCVALTLFFLGETEGLSPVVSTTLQTNQDVPSKFGLICFCFSVVSCSCSLFVSFFVLAHFSYGFITSYKAWFYCHMKWLNLMLNRKASSCPNCWESMPRLPAHNRRHAQPTVRSWAYFQNAIFQMKLTRNWLSNLIVSGVMTTVLVQKCLFTNECARAGSMEHWATRLLSLCDFVVTKCSL